MAQSEEHWRGNGLPSQGEIARRLERVEVDVEKLDARLDEDRVSEAKWRAEVLASLEALRIATESRDGMVAEIQKSRVWMTRTIIAAMIVAVVSGFFTAVIGILNRQLLP